MVLTFADPALTVANKPVEDTLPTLVFEVAHVTDEEIFDFELSEYVPVAVHCVVCPTISDEEAHDTEIKVKITGTGFTVRDTSLEHVPSFVAMIVVVPADAAINSPVFDVVPTNVFEDTHNTDDDMFAVVPSEKVLVAVHCVVSPTVKLVELHEMEIEFKDTGDVFTVMDTPPLVFPSNVAVTPEEPADTPVKTPDDEIVPTLVLVDDNVAEDVMSFIEPSEYVPVTVHWVV